MGNIVFLFGEYFVILWLWGQKQTTDDNISD